ncbi:developmental pluripotency-associated protein 2 [Phodopus roborovskii]|uniref:developmental pluripotency-associated protein 2 n=1 Tax=Phodopus roborovskii TaxID=109678 RepID=UPI0021E43324|nr:developmental pluripotency-associated protein 2 [Phodopus roborovskii]
MSLSTWDAQNKCFKEEFEDEIILTLVPATEEEITTKLPSESVSSTIDHGPPVPPTAPSEEDSKPSTLKLKSHSPLPEILPPITEVSRNTLRAWCRHHNLSTDGKKIDVYLRLQKEAYSEQNCYIPQTSLEAKMKPKLKKAKKGTASMTIKKPMSQNIKSEKENSIVEVITSERESAFAAWGRIATRSGLPRGANCQPLPSNVKSFLPPSPGYRWCVVHGRLLPADKIGWVCLQMSIGHTWVPDSSQRMVSLFLLPACVFPTPGVEDNLLCPECVQSNKRILRNFTRNRCSARKHKRLPPNLPP